MGDNFAAILKRPLYVTQDEELTASRPRLIEALTCLSPLQEAPQETFSCPGVVAGNYHTGILIQELNQSKTQFKKVVKEYLLTQNSKDTALVRALLRAHGEPVIKLKHVYRTLKWVAYHPRRIALGQAISSTHRIISLAEAELLLTRVGRGKHISYQLDQLKTLAPHSSLVIARQVPAHWIANVATVKNEQGISLTTKIKSSLPVFYLHNVHLTPPAVVWARKHTKQALRMDKKIEETPFLPSISAYKYLA